MDSKTISVVVPTRDRPEMLQRCLDPILADAATTEVVVVVDGNDPETEALLERLGRDDPRITVTHTPAEPAELHRVQRGRDHGVGIAGGELVLSIDDDVVAHPGLVSGHARAHAGRDDLVVVGYMPVVTPRRWPRTHAQIETYAGAYEEVCEQFAADPDSILRQLWGGNVSMPRRRWLEAIKRPRVAAPGLDDKELGLLLLEDGMHGAFDRSLRADHHYERNLRALVDRAEKNCVAQAELRAAHPEAGRYADPGPPPRWYLRALRAISRPQAGWLAVKWSLIAAIWVAAALRLGAIEQRAEVALSWLAWDRTEQRLPQGPPGQALAAGLDA